MPGMKAGVLDPMTAKRLMAVLGEMGEYVDEEDLDAIGAQKTLYESLDGGSGGMGAPMAEDEEEESGEGEGAELDYVRLRKEAPEPGYRPPSYGGRRR